MFKNITCNEFYIKLITNLSVHVMASFFKMSMFDPEFIFMGRHCASLQKTTILPRFFTFTLQIIIRDREKLNKAGYTATSCGRVGRGGYASFPAFRLDHLYGPMDGPRDGQTKPRIELRVRNYKTTRV